MQRRTAAFSLVELAIVLVIFGLLAGGVMAGRSLIRASEMRAITVEHHKYAAAIVSFRDKYFAMPGDMGNAYNYFGGTACGTDTTDAAVGCNGNGDGQITYLYGENKKAWEHLSRAGLVEGNYDGNGVDTGAGVLPAANNTPKSKFPLGFWDFNHDIDNMMGSLDGQSMLHFGTIVNGTLNMMQLPSLTLGEAFRLDTKTDDGHANSGEMRGDGGGDCLDIGTDYYGLSANGSNTVNQCVLHFIIM